MSERKDAVTVRIAGEEHVIRSTAEPEYTRRCARFVEERIAQIRGRGGGVDVHRAAILAALSITDELFQLQDLHARSQGEVAERAGGLVRRIEAALSEQPPQGSDDGDPGT
jgi:cell division protein ZapA